ncbi:MAG: ATP-binding cassette domain-containing protein, partial [Tardiphaga sp.]
MRSARTYLPEFAVLLTLVAAPVVLEPLGFSTDLLTRVLNWGLIGLGFDILFGLTGLLSFGQAAFYGVGGFVTAYLLVSGTLGSVWLALLAGTVAAGLFGLLVGWFAVRRIGIYFTMITLAFGQMAYFIENSPLSDYTGGENGIPGVPVPTLGFGASAIRISAGLPMYVLFAVIFFVGYVLARRIVRSPVGAILLAIKENTGRVAMLGHNVPAYKLTAFVIAALYAGLAGGLLGSFQSYMPPDAFSLETSGQLVVQTIVGGAGTLVGPLVGAAVWLWLRDNLQLIPGLATLWKLVLGIAFIVLVIGLRRGICGEIAHWWNERRNLAALRAAEAKTEAIEAHNIDAASSVVAKAKDVALPLAEPSTGDGEIALEARSLARHYGGLKAVDGVSFKVRRGSIHAVIGPNGAGKSTLFKLISSFLVPTNGEVLFNGERISGAQPHIVARRGVVRTFQETTVFKEMTALENVVVAHHLLLHASIPGVYFASSTARADEQRFRDSSAEILTYLGLGHVMHEKARNLPHGYLRALGIAIAMAAEPKVLLLDEPSSG